MVQPPREREPRDAGPFAAAVVVLGWAVAGVVVLLDHDYLDVAISAAAGWLTLVLLVVALMNLVAFLRKAPGESLWPSQRLPGSVRPFLAPGAFLVGIVLGRLIWQ